MVARGFLEKFQAKCTAKVGFESFKNNLKMKKFNVLLSMLFILSVSCNKEIEDIKSSSHESEQKTVIDSVGGYYTDSAFIDNEGMTYNYYVDGIRDKTVDFQKQLTDYNEFIVVSPEYDNTGKISGIAINEFSTVEGYIIFGQKRGDNYWKVIEFENLVSEYAHNNGLEQVFESTGIYPASFINWIDQKVEAIFGPQSNAADGMFTIYKDFYGSGPAWL